MRAALFLLGFLHLCAAQTSGHRQSHLSSHWYNGSYNKTMELVLNNLKGLLHPSGHKEESGSSGVVPAPQMLLLGGRLRHNLPPFAVSSHHSNNTQCILQSQHFLQQLGALQLWAVKMHDASAKLPSGLLSGNVNQFGDFDECLSVADTSSGIRGQFCLAFLQARIKPNSDRGGDRHSGRTATLATILNLMQSHNAFRSKLSDPGHRIPRFSTINWALCVPDSCSAADVQNELSAAVATFTQGTDLSIEVLVESDMCQVKQRGSYTAGFLITAAFIAALVAVTVAATLADLTGRRTPLLHCFSLVRNVKALLDVSVTCRDIPTVHGIKMLNALMLLLSHKSMALFYTPLANRTSMTEALSRPWTVIARAAHLYTDPFILISGLLSAHALSTTLQKSNTLHLKREYTGRLFRIVPMLATVIAVATLLLPELNSGPQWPLTITQHSAKCAATWWRNLLFIHNYFGFENMCLTHTHHLGIDTQLFALAPALTWLLFKWPLAGASVLAALAAVSTALRYQATLANHLSFLIYSGISLSQMLDTANLSYILPAHRLTVYMMGLALGALLHRGGRDVRIKTATLRAGWTLAVYCLAYTVLKTVTLSQSPYDARKAAVYAALSPITWCFFFSWIIFTSHIGQGGWLGRLLNWKFLAIWTRISFAVYLVQFPVFFYNVGVQRSSQEFSVSSLVNLEEYLVIIILSTTLTLLVDFPCNNLKRLLIGTK